MMQMDQSRRNDAALAAAKAQAANSAHLSGQRIDGSSSLSKASKANMEEKKRQEAEREKDLQEVSTILDLFMRNCVFE